MAKQSLGGGAFGSPQSPSRMATERRAWSREASRKAQCYTGARTKMGLGRCGRHGGRVLSFGLSGPASARLPLSELLGRSLAELLGFGSRQRGREARKKPQGCPGFYFGRCRRQSCETLGLQRQSGFAEFLGHVVPRMPDRNSVVHGVSEQVQRRRIDRHRRLHGRGRLEIGEALPPGKKAELLHRDRK